PAPGHVVEKIVVHIDEDPEDEEKQRRTEYLCIVRHQVLQADRSTPETHKTDYEPDQDESQQPQAMLLAQPSLENGQGRLIHSTRLVLLVIRFITPDHGQILQRVQRRRDEQPKWVNADEKNPGIKRDDVGDDAVEWESSPIVPPMAGEHSQC